MTRGVVLSPQEPLRWVPAGAPFGLAEKKTGGGAVQEKKRRRGTCAQGASSLKYGGCSKGVPPKLESPTGARRTLGCSKGVPPKLESPTGARRTFPSNRFAPRLHCGGQRWRYRKARPPGPADATLERQRKSAQGVSGTSKLTRYLRRGQRLSWNQTCSPTAKHFFFSTVHGFLMSQKENGGCRFPAPKRREHSQPLLILFKNG